MTNNSTHQSAHDIRVDELFPHAQDVIWKALTTGDLISLWLMPTQGFAAVKGNHFTFMTKPAGDWDGTIHCEILEVVPFEILRYSWKGGHSSNVAYGAPLDTIVTWTLIKEGQGTRVQMVHSGFIPVTNDSAIKTMGDGWKKVVPTLSRLISEGKLS